MFCFLLFVTFLRSEGLTERNLEKILQRVLLQKKQTPVEKHNSTAFLTPMILFKSYPHNDTFVEARQVKMKAIPDETTAVTYPFVY